MNPSEKIYLCQKADNSFNHNKTDFFFVIAVSYCHLTCYCHKLSRYLPHWRQS